MIDTVREMLDLPREERSRYLAVLPLTRTFVFGAMEESSIKFFRRMIVRHGGTYRECYRTPGLYWVATFRTPRGLRECTLAIVRSLNAELRKSAELHGHLLPEEVDEMMVTSRDVAQNHGDVPALSFERDVWIGDRPRRRESGFHPITGRAL